MAGGEALEETSSAPCKGCESELRVCSGPDLCICYWIQLGSYPSPGRHNILFPSVDKVLTQKEAHTVDCNGRVKASLRPKSVFFVLELIARESSFLLSTGTQRRSEWEGRGGVGWPLGLGAA